MTFEEFLSELIERDKTPLERMHDTWNGEGCWPSELDIVRCRIYAAKDVTHLSRLTLAGQPFKCRFCGSTDKWVVVSVDDTRKKILAFSCPHEPICAGRGMILKQDTVPARIVRDMEITYWPQWLE